MAAVPAVNATACREDDLHVQTLLVLGCLPSPELDPEHVHNGKASPAALTVFRRAAAGAVGLGEENVSAVNVLGLNLQKPPALGAIGMEVRLGGPLLTDVYMEFCARGVSKLPRGNIFEQGFATVVQDYAAFRPSALRVLRLQDLTPRPTVTVAPSPPPVPQTGSSQSHAQEPAPIHAQPLLWVASALLLVVLALCLIAGRLVLKRRKAPGPPLEFEDLTGATAPTQIERNDGNVMVVASAFDPSAQEARENAAAAGLEASECLQVVPGQVMEIVASGEGWLYGRILGEDRWGYLPEVCLHKVPNTPPAADANHSLSLAALAA